MVDTRPRRSPPYSVLRSSHAPVQGATTRHREMPYHGINPLRDPGFLTVALVTLIVSRRHVPA